jgi:hypothetical protein
MTARMSYFQAWSREFAKAYGKPGAARWMQAIEKRQEALSTAIPVPPAKVLKMCRQKADTHPGQGQLIL